MKKGHYKHRVGLAKLSSVVRKYLHERSVKRSTGPPTSLILS